jgi:hypothetical protein
MSDFFKAISYGRNNRRGTKEGETIDEVRGWAIAELYRPDVDRVTIFQCTYLEEWDDFPPELEQATQPLDNPDETVIEEDDVEIDPQYVGSGDDS